MKKRNYLVPISKDTGKLSSTNWGDQYVMVPNFEVNLDLRLVEIRPTRGSFRAVLEDIHGYTYPMMGSDFNNMLKRSGDLPRFDGTFTVAHKSYDYTIRLVDPANDEPLNEARMLDMMNDNRRLNHV
jgi:hypothetical protein